MHSFLLGVHFSSLWQIINHLFLLSSAFEKMR